MKFTITRYTYQVYLAVTKNELNKNFIIVRNFIFCPREKPGNTM